MWTVNPTPITGAISIIGNSHPPPRNYDEIHRRFIHIPTKSQSVGVLGQTLLLSSAANSNTNNKPIPKKEEEMSGSDVLWAIQRATAQRNKRSNADKRNKTMMTRRKIEVSSSVGESTGDNGVDYSNVRPLRIKSDWGQRLEEFEKVLKEFQETGL